MKTKMTVYKKMIGSLLIGLQLTGAAFADVGAQTRAQNAFNDTQETALLSSLIALSGSQKNPDTFRAKALPLIADYEKASPNDEGRSDRFAQAMIEMNLMQPAQAESLKASVDATIAQKFQANPNMTDAEREQIIQDMTVQELNRSYKGAQFSACLGLGIGGGTVLAAAILMNVYASTLTHSKSSASESGTVQGSGTSTTSTQGSSSSSTTTTVSGTSTTSSSSVTTHATEQKILNAVAGISYGIAGVIAILMLGSDSCNGY